MYRFKPALIALILFLFAGPALSADLQNWSFESWTGDLADDWTFDQFASIDYTQNTETVYHGESSVEVNKDAYQSNFMMTQTIANPLVPPPGDDQVLFCDASLYVLDNTTGSQVALEIIMLDSNGDEEAQFIGDQSQNMAQWQEITVGGWTTANTDSVRFIIHLQSNFQFGNSTFYLDQAQFYTQTSIADIQAEPDRYDGQRVRTSGVITQATNSVHTDYCDGYMQADSAGIMLYDPAPLPVPLNRLDAVTVTAQVEETPDVTRLVDFVYEDVGELSMPQPWRTATGNYGDAIEEEGRWTELVGTLTTAPGSPGTDYTVSVNDGSGVTNVQIWADAGLDLSAFDIGDNVRMRGTMDVDQGTAFLQPSEPEDVYAVPELVDFTITAVGDSIIPAGGGQTIYDASLMNNSGQSVNNIAAWRSILAPNGQVYGPFMLQYFDMSSTFDATVNDIVQPVPAWAPAGTYVVYHNLGFSTETSLAWDQYSFEKTAAADGISQADFTGGWDSVSNSEELHWKVQEEISDEPAESIDMFSMDPVTPNPFNPSTTVTVTFPQRAELEITVYDVLGRQVAALAKGSYEAGPHQFVLDGSSLASGAYFIHAKVPGELNETRKVMLVR